MNGELVATYTAQMHLERAFPLSRLWLYLAIAGGGDDRPSHHQLADEIRNAMRVARGLDDLTDEKVDQAILRLKTPSFAVLPPPYPDEDVLSQLQRRFPTLTFLLHTGEEMPDPSQLPARVERLYVDADSEMDHYLDYTQALDIARGTFG
jgi:hypothetical protein